MKTMSSTSGSNGAAQQARRIDAAELKDRAALVIDRTTLLEPSGSYALRDMLHAGERPRLRPDQVLEVAGPGHSISCCCAGARERCPLNPIIFQEPESG